ncbi:MAG TPA: lipid-transfer protein [Steroidobacteraceae bacterium]|nr:lipid-transfer protein [Steroidobacteraceae bacterium]
MSHALRDQAAVVGIGATEFSKDSGRSELRLALEAITAALADAGLSAAEVDGLCTYAMDRNPEIEVFRNLGGRELKFFARTEYGGGAACAPLLQAALAVHAGVAQVVVCYRAMNERSQYRFGQGFVPPPVANAESANWAWTVPFGLVTPAAWVAMAARRYMHQYGATSEDFGRVSVACRRHAASNPRAWFYRRPITLADHQASRWIVEPLRLLDCCQESDGAVALVITSAARARHLRQKPALIRAAAQGAQDEQMNMTSFYREDIGSLAEMQLVAAQLYAMGGLGARDIQTAILYDHFSPFVLPQLEVFGFCARGEAREFIRDGHIELGGRLPVNPHGGQLGEAYIHGLNGVAEAVRQVRGTSVNQVAGVENVLVTAGPGVPTSGAVLAAG